MLGDIRIPSKALRDLMQTKDFIDAMTDADEACSIRHDDGKRDYEILERGYDLAKKSLGKQVFKFEDEDFSLYFLAIDELALHSRIKKLKDAEIEGC